MKGFISFLIMCSLLFSYNQVVNAQVKNPVKKAEREGERRVNRGIDRTIDRGFDKLEEGIGGLFKKGKKDKTSESEKAEGTGQPDEPGKSNEAVAGSSSDKQAGPALNWAKYDFVPGDKIIFEDNLVGEENGEFPSRWDLHDGNIEVAQLNGENVIMFREYSSTIIPYISNSDKDYLPDVFTIEFDAFVPHDALAVYFYDAKNQPGNNRNGYLNVWGHGLELRPASSNLPGGVKLNNQWMHVAVAYTNGQMRAYINDSRLINIPHLDFNPTGISVRALHSSDKTPYYVKNFRIAEGGVRYYDRFMQDGKIIANGIRFDVNKATLKPESMGVINEIYDLMKEHSDISFSVEGHTDSDGDNAFNQTLSEQRAETVVNTLKELGIDGSRMTSKGWGESKPLDTNATAEGKANNRRVEFVKQ